jgi:hypothetical protein
VLSELNFYLKWGGQGEEKKTGSRQEEVSMVDTDKSKHHIKDVDHLRIAEAPPPRTFTLGYIHRIMFSTLTPRLFYCLSYDQCVKGCDTVARRSFELFSYL